MSRTAARSHAFKLVFIYEFLHSDPDEIFEIYLSRHFKKVDEYEKRIIYDEFIGISENLGEIDEIISDNSKWDFNRLNKIDLALIRLAIYELYYEKNKIPIVINEIVNLANKYGTENHQAL